MQADAVRAHLGRKDERQVKCELQPWMREGCEGLDQLRASLEAQKIPEQASGTLLEKHRWVFTTP